MNTDLARLADGDRSAAEPVFRALWPVVRAFATKALRDPERAEDVAQQALMKLFEQASEFDTSRDAVAWAIEITSWEIRTERRKALRSREDPWSVALESVSSGVTPELAVAGAELTAALHETVSFLSEADRETLATVMNDTTPPVAGATWRKRKERALTRLRAAWRRLHESE